MRQQSHTMQLVGVSDNKEFNLTGSGDTVRLIGNSVSADFFSMLGALPAMGRTFHDGEDQPGKDSVVILSRALWEQPDSMPIRILWASGSRWRERAARLWE